MKIAIAGLIAAASLAGIAAPASAQTYRQEVRREQRQEIRHEVRQAVRHHHLRKVKVCRVSRHHRVCTVRWVR